MFLRCPRPLSASQESFQPPIHLITHLINRLINHLVPQEWFQTLIRLAVMRRDALNPKAKTTVAEELRSLIEVQLKPNVDPRALPDLHKFRKENCYTAEVSFILEDHEETLRNLFVEFAKGDGTALYDELKSAKLLSYNEWKMLTRDLEMMNELDFTVRRRDETMRPDDA